MEYTHYLQHSTFRESSHADNRVGKRNSIMTFTFRRYLDTPPHGAAFVGRREIDKARLIEAYFSRF